MIKTDIEVEMLPAGHGDALLVTYGDSRIAVAHAR